ncbi:MAG: hypothetical protein IJV73_01440 [Clostridia bacterium]|nr:hypothetical protein [Clostridia bacterium]
MKKNKKKKKVVYLEDKGETVYSMAALEGRTPEEQEEYDRKRKSRISAAGKERWAMLTAAFSVYGPILLLCVASFFVAALLLYLFLR